MLDTTVIAHTLAAYLNSAEIVDASVVSTARASVVSQATAEPKSTLLVRSFVHASPWENILNSGEGAVNRTSVSIDVPFYVESATAEDIAIGHILEFAHLRDGWDGESAEVPNKKALQDAVLFIRSVAVPNVNYEPTLHVDGSVIIELDGDLSGSLRFKGDGLVIHALEGSHPGQTAIGSFTLPNESRVALAA